MIDLTRYKDFKELNLILFIRCKCPNVHMSFIDYIEIVNTNS